MNYLPPNVSPVLLFVILVWSTAWKIVAIWRASKNNQIYWFVILFLINSIGILDLIYLFRFAKKKMTIEDLKKKNFFPS